MARRLKFSIVFRRFFRLWILFVLLAASLCLLFVRHQSQEKILLNLAAISTSPKSLLTSIDAGLFKYLVRSNGFLAATKTNAGKSSTLYSVCVVDPAISECGHLGFAAFLLTTLDHIMLCRALGSDQPVVFWRACSSGCSRDRAVNSWSWYFEPVNPGLELQVERVLCLLLGDNIGKRSPDSRSILNNSFKNRSSVNGFEKSRMIDTKERIRANKLIKQYVKPNSIIKEKVKSFYLRYLAGFTVLGVHVRGTDHWIETVEKRLPPQMDWVKSAKTIVETLSRPRKIFIASDNNEIIERFLTFFGKDLVVYTKAFRARRYHSRVPPHEFKFDHNPADPYERAVGTQVLMDILLLAKCDHFLHAESSVASLASYFNPHMKSYFMDGTFMKGQDKVRDRPETNRKRNAKQEDLDKEDEEEEDFQGLDRSSLECFLKNHATSTCSNAAKGIFVNLEGAKRFLKGY